MKFIRPLWTATAFIATLSSFTVYADDNPVSQTDPLPDLATVYENWGKTAFSIDAMASIDKRSPNGFKFSVEGVEYPVVFDAGRKKRQALLECLEKADKCKATATAFMLFEAGTMQLNITDIHQAFVPPVDFDQESHKLTQCYAMENRRVKGVPGEIEVKLTVADINFPQAHLFEPVMPVKISPQFDLLVDAVKSCGGNRYRLPVGEYGLKTQTLTGTTFLTKWAN